jgi:S1-C subfamily serine protease
LADFVVFPSEVDAPEAAKIGIILATEVGELKVTGVASGSGAEEAGVEEGDIILVVDDQDVRDIDDLKAVLAAKNIGDTVRLKVRRHEATVELDVELGR